MDSRCHGAACLCRQARCGSCKQQKHPHCTLASQPVRQTSNSNLMRVVLLVHIPKPSYSSISYSQPHCLLALRLSFSLVFGHQWLCHCMELYILTVYMCPTFDVFALNSFRLLDIAGTGGRVRLASLQRGRPLRAKVLGQSRATCLTYPASLVSGRCCDLRRAKTCCQSFTRAPHTCTQLSPPVHVTRMV
jgi:hypothetical protein